MDEETIGDRIKQRRTELGLGIRDLARRAHVDPGWISRLESGERSNLSLEVAKRIAQALGVSLDYLAGRYKPGKLEAAGAAAAAT